MTETFRGLYLSLHVRKISGLIHDLFLPNTLRIIIHLSLYHLTVHTSSVATGRVVKDPAKKWKLPWFEILSLQFHLRTEKNHEEASQNSQC
jgi:hypothetical protein